MSQQFTKHIDNYPTPKTLYDSLDSEFHFDYDPCPINPEGLRDFDGLGEWQGTSIFINPPYSNPKIWIEKVVQEQRKGKTIVMLLRVDTSTNYFHELVLPNAELRWIRGRVRFKGKLAPFPSYLAIFRGKSP